MPGRVEPLDSESLHWLRLVEGGSIRVATSPVDKRRQWCRVGARGHMVGVAQPPLRSLLARRLISVQATMEPLSLVSLSPAGRAVLAYVRGAS